MTDYKQLCVELLSELENAIRVIHAEAGTRHISGAYPVINKVKNTLAEPEPEPPTDEEVDVWVDRQGFIRGHGDHPCGFWIDDGDAGALVRAALARWGNYPASPDSSTSTRSENV